MVHGVSPIWPTLLAVSGILLILRETVGFRKNSDLSATSRLFLLLAASLFAVAGLADIIVRAAVTGAWR